MSNEIHSGHIHDMTDALHKDTNSDIPGFGPLYTNPFTMTCSECSIKEYPPCEEAIPCCQCKRDTCNSRQPCPKKGGKQ